MEVVFTKYQGLGNDFILIDNRHAPQPLLTSQQAIALCDRHFGVGGDGVIFALAGGNGSDYTMRIFNSDGSEPEMCGNGIRCLAKFLATLENRSLETSHTYRIHTGAGLIQPELLPDGQVRVDMGPPRLLAEEIPTTLAPAQEKVINRAIAAVGQNWAATCVSMGNPHCVVFVADVDALDLAQIGPHFEHHQAFPQRTNTEFIQVISPNYIKMRVWERGAGITLACGTGACAAVVAGVLTNQTDRTCTVELPGGCLEITWAEDRVYMTGPAVAVFHGAMHLAL